MQTKLIRFLELLWFVGWSMAEQEQERWDFDQQKTLFSQISLSRFSKDEQFLQYLLAHVNANVTLLVLI